jgi:hypothetical protein
MEQYDLPYDDKYVERHSERICPEVGMILSRYNTFLKGGIEITFGDDVKNLRLRFIRGASDMDDLEKIDHAMELVNAHFINPVSSLPDLDKAIGSRCGCCVDKAVTFSILLNYEKGIFEPNFSVTGGLVLSEKNLCGHAWVNGEVNGVSLLVDVTANNAGIPVKVLEKPAKIKVFSNETVVSALKCHRRAYEHVEKMFADDDKRKENAEMIIERLSRENKSLREIERDRELNQVYAINKCHGKIMSSFEEILRDRGQASREYWPQAQVALTPINKKGCAKSKTAEF